MHSWRSATSAARGSRQRTGAADAIALACAVQPGRAVPRRPARAGARARLPSAVELDVVALRVGKVCGSSALDPAGRLAWSRSESPLGSPDRDGVLAPFTEGKQLIKPNVCEQIEDLSRRAWRRPHVLMT